MNRSIEDIFGILRPQVLWAFLAITACDSPKQVMPWAEPTNYDNFLAALASNFWGAGNLGQNVIQTTYAIEDADEVGHNNFPIFESLRIVSSGKTMGSLSMDIDNDTHVRINAPHQGRIAVLERHKGEKFDTPVCIVRPCLNNLKS